jgi:hypothetical protein
MSEDPRCCGTGTCIISADGVCWCGQRWDGEKMCFASADATLVTGNAVQDTITMPAAAAQELQPKQH